MSLLFFTKKRVFDIFIAIDFHDSSLFDKSLESQKDSNTNSRNDRIPPPLRMGFGGWFFVSLMFFKSQSISSLRASRKTCAII
ncbi:hypothetical protein [Helicobacter sp. T3_23-1059]